MQIHIYSSTTTAAVVKPAAWTDQLSMHGLFRNQTHVVRPSMNSATCLHLGSYCCCSAQQQQQVAGTVSDHMGCCCITANMM